MNQCEMKANHLIIWSVFNGVFLLYVLVMCIYVIKYRLKQKESSQKNNSIMEDLNSKSDVLLKET